MSDGTGLIGTTLGTYRIERLIGEGGSASVYLAQDERERLRRKVAVKILHPVIAADEEYRTRFAHESQAVAGMATHPNIVQVLDVGEQDGRLFIVMVYVDGTDLKEEISRTGGIDLPLLDRVLTQVADALDAAHAAQIVHRDVKPGNILLSRDLRHAYLADFGIVKQLDADDLTRSPAFRGTVLYSAPEQLGNRGVTRSADIYSLGCVVFQALTGRPPFEGTVETVIADHLQTAPPKATDLRPELPAEFDDIIARAMAKQPADRYASAGALAEAVTRVVARMPRPTPVLPVVDGFDRLRPAGPPDCFQAHTPTGERFLLRHAGRPDTLDPVRLAAELAALSDLAEVPGVVLPDALADSDVGPFLVEPWLDARSLAQPGWTVGEVLDAGVAAAEALSAVHARGALHLQVEPADLLVDRAGATVLSGFVPRVAHRSTSPYAAPEQLVAGADAESAVTVAHALAGVRPGPRTDVYRLAAALHGALTGSPPYGIHDGLEAQVLAARTHAPLGLDHLGVPRAVADALHWGLSPDPADRPDRCALLGRRLRDLRAAMPPEVAGRPVWRNDEPSPPIETDTSPDAGSGTDDRTPHDPELDDRTEPHGPEVTPDDTVRTAWPPVPDPVDVAAPPKRRSRLVAPLVVVAALVIGGGGGLLVMRASGGSGGTTTTTSTTTGTTAPTPAFTPFARPTNLATAADPADPARSILTWTGDPTSTFYVEVWRDIGSSTPVQATAQGTTYGLDLPVTGTYCFAVADRNDYDRASDADRQLALSDPTCAPGASPADFGF